jgi:hypothetical protein
LLNYSVSIYHQQWCSNASGEQIRTDDSIGARRFCAIRRRKELPFPLGFGDNEARDEAIGKSLLFHSLDANVLLDDGIIVKMETKPKE